MKKRVRLTESDLHGLIKESVKKIITEKHRPSGVSRRIHTRDANGNKESFDYIPNLPKYNKYQDFNKASKFQRINARPVEDPNGEDIDTVLKDGTIERKGLHLPQGYYNVNNDGGTEHWGIDPKTFNKKYEADPAQQGVYKPNGGPMMASNPLKRHTSFQAPWGGRMDMKAGSRILQDPNNKKDTYGIGGNEFDSTYKFDESRKNLNKIIKESVKNVLREYGSDGPDKVFFSDGNPNQDDSYGELDPSVDFDWMNNLEYYPKTPDAYNEYVPSASDYDNFDDMVESKGRMGRIIMEAVKKVLRESDDDYKSTGWADKDGEIRKNPKNGHVKRFAKKANWNRIPDKVGDYESTGWGDKDGHIFHNPKNGHVKRIKNFDDSNKSKKGINFKDFSK
jgi:hypothetical protein